MSVLFGGPADGLPRRCRKCYLNVNVAARAKRKGDNDDKAEPYCAGEKPHDIGEDPEDGAGGDAVAKRQQSSISGG